MKNFNINITSGSKPNTKWLHINDVRLFVSYETVMGFSGTIDGDYVRFRRDHHVSNTTARHMAAEGVREWTKKSDAEFEQLLDDALMESIDPKIRTMLLFERAARDETPR